MLLSDLSTLPEIQGYPGIRPKSLRFAICKHHGKLIL